MGVPLPCLVIGGHVSSVPQRLRCRIVLGAAGVPGKVLTFTLLFG